MSVWSSPELETSSPHVLSLAETQMASSSLVHSTASGEVSMQHPDLGV